MFKVSDDKCNSLYDRVNKLLVSRHWSDCSFSVSGKKFKAHKLILGISSPVFEAMFYGPMSSNNEIVITDILPDVFQLVLKYIYTDKIVLTSIEETYEVMYVAKKYFLEYLYELCICHIQRSITVDNVITILNTPDYLQDNRLHTASLKRLTEHANHVLVANLNTISLSCMQKILLCDSMNINEKDLIKCVFKWTEYYCQQNNFEIEFKKRRNILIEKGLFQLLRFGTLSLTELNEIVHYEHNMLLTCETDTIRQYLINKNSATRLNSNTVSPLCIPRNEIKLQWKLCHRSPLRSMSPVTVNIDSNSIETRLKVSKSIFINSFSIPSRMGTVVDYCNNATNLYCEQFNVSVINENDNSINKDITITKVIQYDSDLDVVFSQPLFIKENEWYKITFVWPEQTTYFSYSYAVQSRECSYGNSKLNFKFEDSVGSFIRALTFRL